MPFYFCASCTKGFTLAGVRVVFVQVAQMVAWFCTSCTMCSGREWMRFVQHAQMEMCFCATCTKREQKTGGFLCNVLK